MIRFEEPVRGALHPAAGGGSAPCVVIAHGFKAFMGWGMFPWLAERLAAAGYAAVRFDFSCNGADAEGNFTQLDRFERNTLTQEQEDLAALVAAIRRGEEPFGGHCAPTAIALLGHSRGAGGAILQARRDPAVAAVVAMAGVARANRFPAAARAMAERQGSFPIVNARTRQLMPVGLAFFEDADRHDIRGSAAAMGQPLLLLHGTADETVPVAEAHALRDAAGGRATLVEIEGAGHTFGAVHPFAGPTPHLERAADAAVRFLDAHLGAHGANRE